LQLLADRDIVADVMMKEPLETVTGAGHRLGEYIRDQRKNSQISLRQLATLAGVSNPYLSQIERGLRKPSAEILQQIAKGLRISAEALYLQAGILEQRDGDRLVVDAVLSDEALSERQKQVLLEIYDSFCKENAAPSAVVSAPAPPPAEPAPAAPSPARKAAGRKPGATTRTAGKAAARTTPPTTPLTTPNAPQEASA
jgi:transcriptional regulator with XRE-family HTH domain